MEVNDHGVSLSSGQSLLRGEAIPFKLENGQVGLIAPEQRRIYDRIIHSNVGKIAPSGMTDDQVKDILSKSQLPLDDLEYIWSLTTMIEAEGLPDGCWTQLEVYVALSFVQAHIGLILNEMEAQFSGPIPVTAKKITRRSSYAQAGSTNKTHPTSLVPSLVRAQSSGGPSTLSAVNLLRHARTDAGETARVRRLHSRQTLSSDDGASLSQAGLEVLDTVEELGDWDGHAMRHTSTVLHQVTSQSHISQPPDGFATVFEVSSRRTNTVDRAERLANLIKTRCPGIFIDPNIEAPDHRVRAASEVDRHDALDILARNRNVAKGWGGKFKSKISKKTIPDYRNRPFGHEELNHAMKEAVEFGRVGVAETLLDMGADIDFLKDTKHTFKGILGKTVDPTPTGYIQTAVSSNNIGMVKLLASRKIETTALEEALEKAVQQNLQEMVLTLIQYGVDPNAKLGTIFKSAVTSQKPAIVKLLLRARTSVKEAFLNAMLPVAVAQGQEEIVGLLIVYGADVNSDHALGLRRAVQAQRIDLVLRIMSRKPSAQAVSSAIADAFSVNSSSTTSEKYLLLEILLCGGATGDPVANALIQVVRAGHLDIVRLLVMYGASLQYNDAEALKIAVRKGNTAVLETLLLGDITQSRAAQLFYDIPQPFTEVDTYKAMSALISKGAVGAPLDKALVAAVQQKCLRITELLLNHQATVNHNNAQALQMAVRMGDLKTVDLLLSRGRPQPQSMDYVLPLVPSGPPRLKYEMTKSIIDAASPARISASVLDVALMKAVDTNDREVDMDLVNLLISAGANVECSNGMCFQFAARKGSVELLNALMGNMSQPSPPWLSTVVPEIMKLTQPQLRRRLMVMILDRGAHGPNVSQALIDAIEENPVDEKLVFTLLTKANVDHSGGLALSRSVQCCTTKIVSSIIDVGKPRRQTRLAALIIAIEPATKDREAKLNLLLRAGIDQRGLDEALAQEVSNDPNSNMNIIKTLLDCGASCEYDAGKVLKLSIRYMDHQLLKTLVASKPNSQILASMIPLAMHTAHLPTRYSCISILLESGARGDQISAALTKEILESHACDRQLVRLLIQHGAKADFSNGAAIKSVVSKPLHIDLLEILLTAKGASHVVASLVPLAMSHVEEIRLPFLRVLLDSGARGSQVDAALLKAVSEGLSSQTTITFLLQCDASVNFDNGAAIKLASAAGSTSILECLLQKRPRFNYLVGAFSLAMQAPSTHPGFLNPTRLSCVRLLTEAGVRGSDSVHFALIRAVQERDHDLVDHLINSGGCPNFRSGASVSIATEQFDIRSLTLLTKSKPTPQVFSCAFSATSNNIEKHLGEPELFLNINKILLKGGAGGPAVDQALIHALTLSSDIATKHADMILKYCPLLDVNYNGGECLRIAARKPLPEVIKNLLERKPTRGTFRSAFISIFESDASEETLVKVVQLFFEHSKGPDQISFERDDPSKNPLYQCLHRHADKPELLQCLLRNGCRPDCQFSWIFSPEHGEEKTSALLWLLCQDGPADRRVVQSLLDYGVDPNFRTSGSGASPLIIAAASSQSQLVLQLLEANALPDSEDSLHKTALNYATETGNLKSVEYLLNFEAEIDDESLHIAASHANASMVKLLFAHGASKDHPGTLYYDGRTALGELCLKANPATDSAQIKDLLKVFEQVRPNFEKLAQNKSCIFLALDNDSPLAMTRMLLTSISHLREKINEDFNVYRFERGLHYSPTMYVRHFKCRQSSRQRLLLRDHDCCRLEGCPGRALEKMLRAFGCKDRFWDEEAGAEQPLGACGLPSHILRAQRQAEETREQQAKKQRLREEEIARRDAEQADLDAAAEAERRREREGLALVEQKRQADAKEERRRLDLIKAEHNAESERRNREFQEQQQRVRSAAREEEESIKRKNSLKLSALEQQARIKTDLAKEQRRLISSASEMMREARVAGITNVNMGRILEIEE